MINSPPFYHGTIRRMIVSFGKLFENIVITKYDKQGKLAKYIEVPLSYGPKEKWLRRLEEDADLEKNVEIVLPRMSFEITNYQYDAARKVGASDNFILGELNDKPVKLFSPVPWNIDISLYIMTKTQEDGLQIMEQILPHFSPVVTTRIEVIPELKITQNIPFSLESTNVQDTWDGNFEQRRTIITTLQFQAKVNLFGPIFESDVIKRVIVDSSLNAKRVIDTTYTAEIDPFTAERNDDHQILEGWENPL